MIWPPLKHLLKADICWSYCLIVQLRSDLTWSFLSCLLVVCWDSNRRSSLPPGWTSHAKAWTPRWTTSSRPSQRSTLNAACNMTRCCSVVLAPATNTGAFAPAGTIVAASWRYAGTAYDHQRDGDWDELPGEPRCVWNKLLKSPNSDPVLLPRIKIWLPKWARLSNLSGTRMIVLQNRRVWSEFVYMFASGLLSLLEWWRNVVLFHTHAERLHRKQEKVSDVWMSQMCWLCVTLYSIVTYSLIFILDAPEPFVEVCSAIFHVL